MKARIFTAETTTATSPVFKSSGKLSMFVLGGTLGGATVTLHTETDETPSFAASSFNSAALGNTTFTLPKGVNYRFVISAGSGRSIDAWHHDGNT